MFRNVITILQVITQAHFDNAMPEAESYFLGPNKLGSFYSPVDPARPIGRRSLMWAKTKLMITMTSDERVGFHAGRSEPTWQGRKLGMIEIAFTRAPNVQPDSDPTSVFAKNPSSENINITALKDIDVYTTTIVGDNRITWAFQPGGPLMTQYDVAMGTIGALIQAVEHS